jgi:hypothetical protein
MRPSKRAQEVIIFVATLLLLCGLFPVDLHRLRGGDLGLQPGDAACPGPWI